MGSPDFAVPTLETLAAHYPVVGVVTQPDRPAGRGGTLKPPAVKEAASASAFPAYKPKNYAPLRRWINCGPGPPT